jgi:diadenosine tetraphosphate (Ap4A) HIT family hydrolase
MDLPPYTNDDRVRIALSKQLQQLSEALRLAVTAEESDDSSAPEGLMARLRAMLISDIPTLEETVVGYARHRGDTWHEITDLTGVDAEEAQRRWAGAQVSMPADPEQETLALDSWYTMHAQMEPLGRVRDPFSRLLSGREPAGKQCLICAKYDGRPVPPWAGWANPPGGHVIDDEHWRVGHGPTPYWPAGTLIIESRRHFVDYADLNAQEAAAIGPLIQRLTDPLKEATGAPRIHVFSCMEGTEHFHVWLVPRRGEVSMGRTFIGNPGYCSPVEAEDVIVRLREALQKSEEPR